MTAPADAADPGPAPFAHVALIGLGLIASSMAHAIRAVWPAVRITGYARSPGTRDGGTPFSIDPGVLPVCGGTWAIEGSALSYTMARLLSVADGQQEEPSCPLRGAGSPANRECACGRETEAGSEFIWCDLTRIKDSDSRKIDHK